MNEYWLIQILGFLLSIAASYLIFKLWPRSGKMGINTNTVHCPCCGTKAPMFRIPKNLKQLLWGGWSCQKCGCEFDKYGNKLDDRT
ncbi:MAG: hypothetical protein IE885_09205 [Campylobacterales bacterium]|nr:hypothetical protein [Campylobacterales bacterium]